MGENPQLTGVEPVEHTYPILIYSNCMKNRLQGVFL